MSRTFRAILLLLLPATASFSDQLYTAVNGRSIVVKDDGAWQLASQSDIIADKLRNGSGQANSFDLTSDDGALVIPEATKFPAQRVDPPLLAAVGSDRAFDVRGVRWGMTAAEIKSSERARLTNETASSLSFRVAGTGISVAAQYGLTGGKLTSASITVTQTRVPADEFYKGFEALVLHCCKIHGTPTTRDYAWKNEMYKNDESQWGVAIAKGHLTCRLSWTSARTRVDLRTTGTGNVFATVIELRAR